MIRQTITREQYNKLSQKQYNEFVSKVRGSCHTTIKVVDVTIGVLQGLLLDTGYRVTIDKFEHGGYITYIEQWEEAIMKYIKVMGRTMDEPIDVLLEAVLTLVIGD